MSYMIILYYLVIIEMGFQDIINKCRNSSGEDFFLLSPLVERSLPGVSGEKTNPLLQGVSTLFENQSISHTEVDVVSNSPFMFEWCDMLGGSSRLHFHDPLLKPVLFFFQSMFRED